MDSAGIEIVRSMGRDSTLQWTFDERNALGSAAADSESVEPQGAWAVSADSGGRIYVLDRVTRRIVVFDTSGTRLLTIGAGGSGPAEFVSPAGLAVAPDGAIFVHDVGKRAVMMLDPIGEALGSIRLEASAAENSIGVADGSLAVKELERGRTLEVSSEHIIIYRRNDTVAVTSLSGWAPRIVTFTRCRLRLALPAVFAPTLVWTASHSMVLVAAGPDYAITVYDNATPVRSFRRVVKRRRASMSLAIKEAGQGLTVRHRGWHCTVRPGEAVRARGVFPFLPAIRRLAVGTDGLVWVQRGSVRGEDALIDILDRGGVYLGTLPPRSPFPLAFLPDGDIVSIRPSGEGLSQVVLYRVSRDPGKPPSRGRERTERP